MSNKINAYCFSCLAFNVWENRCERYEACPYIHPPTLPDDFTIPTLPNDLTLPVENSLPKELTINGIKYRRVGND